MDRFQRGLVSGILSGIVMNIIDLFNYHVLHLTTFRMLDWASVMIYGHRPNSLPEAVYALMTQLMWTGVLGVIFSFILIKVHSEGDVVKGATYGFITGFLIFAVAIAFRMPHLSQIPFKTSLSNGVEGIIWGMLLAYILRRVSTARRAEG